jgi:N-acetyl-beta-hexosaminidase
MKQFLIEIASLPDREHVVAEIWFDNQMIAEVSQDTGELVVEFYSNENLSFDYDRFCEVLEEAKIKLLEF